MVFIIHLLFLLSILTENCIELYDFVVTRNVLRLHLPSALSWVNKDNCSVYGIFHYIFIILLSPEMLPSAAFLYFIIFVFCCYQKCLEAISSICCVSWVRRDNCSIRYSEAVKEKECWNEINKESCNSVPLADRIEQENGDTTRLRLSRDFERHEMRNPKAEPRQQTEFYEEWMLLASLLDRVFFIVYLIINVAAASAIFTRAIPST